MLHTAIGWLTNKGKQAHPAVGLAYQIIGKINLKRCLVYRLCNGHGIGSCGFLEQNYWSVPLTVNQDTNQPNIYSWMPLADESLLVSLVLGMVGIANETQYLNVVQEQAKFSPCVSWHGITVDQAQWFN